jgi:hypothetical protein
MTDSRSQTQKIQDEQLKTRVRSSVESLCKILDEDAAWDEARGPLTRNGLLVIELDQLNHAGIRDLKKDVGHVTGELETMNGLIQANGKEPVLTKGPLAGLPVKYVFYTAVVVLFLLTGFLLFAIAHGKLSDVAEAVNTIRGKAVTEEPVSGEAVGRNP